MFCTHGHSFGHDPMVEQLDVVAHYYAHVFDAGLGEVDRVLHTVRDTAAPKQRGTKRTFFGRLDSVFRGEMVPYPEFRVIILVFILLS